MTEVDFWMLLEKSPNDWDLRSVFADWLEDHGALVWAQGQRWQILEGRWPSKYGVLGWTWLRQHTNLDQACRLSTEIWNGLNPEPYFRGQVCADYSTLKEAETALAHSLWVNGIQPQK